MSEYSPHQDWDPRAEAVPNAMDPPEHARFRRLIEPYFAPGPMRDFEPLYSDIADKLVDALPAEGEILRMDAPLMSNRRIATCPVTLGGRRIEAGERLQSPEDPFSVFRCRQIGNCKWVCPKGLNPKKAIGRIREMLLKEGV